MVFISSKNDDLADPADLNVLRKRLRVKLQLDYVVPDLMFNHVSG